MRWAQDGRGVTLAIMALAGVALYAASRTAVGVLAGDGLGRAGWRAVGHWIPIAAVALVAAALGHPDIAVALAFATSIASLAFVLGVLTYLAPMEHPPATRRAWPFVLPAALLPLIAGFSGQFAWVHALAMALLGVALLAAWRDPALREGDAAAVPFADAAGAASAPRPAWLLAAELTLALALAVVGAWAAVVGTLRASAATRVFSPGLITVAVVGPLVALPMLNPGPVERARAQTASMASTLVAVTLLNLCALLPLLTFFWYVKTGLAAPAPGGAGLSFAALGGTGQPLPYPLATWRVDAVILTVLAFVLVPVSLGRWELGRGEGVGLILGYAMYLILEAAVTVRL
jgi:hypothetical protein